MVKRWGDIITLILGIDHTTTQDLFNVVNIENYNAILELKCQTLAKSKNVYRIARFLEEIYPIRMKKLEDLMRKKAGGGPLKGPIDNNTRV